MDAESAALVIAQAGLLTVGAVVVVLWLRRLLKQRLGDRATGSSADTVMEPLAGVYGLLLALLVGSVADRRIELRAALVEEAQAYHRMIAITQRLPAPWNQRLHESLQRYARVELDARKAMRISRTSTELLDDIWLTLTTFTPVMPQHNLMQQEALNDLRVLRDQRAVATRANQSTHGVLIWLVLMVGAIAVVGVSALAGLADPRAPIYLAALTTVITITLFVFYALSRPLSGAAIETFASQVRN